MPPDGGGEVGVDRGCQPVVAEGGWGDGPGGEVLRLGHASSGHDADDLIEVRVVVEAGLVEGLCEALR